MFITCLCKKGINVNGYEVISVKYKVSVVRARFLHDKYIHVVVVVVVYIH